jgi:hypothetical protein
MTRQTEPTRNPNLRMNLDPPGWQHIVPCLMVESDIAPERRASRRTKAEAARIRAGAPHRVDCFHQHQEPDLQPAEQVIGALAERCAIEVVRHAIRAMGGKNQFVRSSSAPDSIVTRRRRSSASKTRNSRLRHQFEVTEELGPSGVPSNRLRDGAGQPDLCVGGRDRLWLVSAEIRRRTGAGQ